MHSVLQRFADLLRSRLGARPGGYPRHRRPAPGSRREAGPAADPELAGLYANLETPYGADLETARAAWKRLVRKYHPDLHGADGERQRIATELVKRLNQSFERLRGRLEDNPRQTR